MADEDKQSGAADLADAEEPGVGENENPGSVGGPRASLSPVLPLIYIGRTFSGGILITGFSVDGRGQTAADKQIAVKAGSRVIILGENLDRFDSLALRLGNAVYAPLDLNIFPRQISFAIKDYDRDLLSGGGVIRLEFLSAFNPRLSARLDNRLIYKTQKQVEEAQKQAAGEKAAGEPASADSAKGAGGQDFGFDLARLGTESAGQAIKGVLGGLAAGVSGKKGAGQDVSSKGAGAGGVFGGRAGSVRGESGRQAGRADVEAETDIDAEMSPPEISGGEAEIKAGDGRGAIPAASGTAEVGGRTISRGSTTAAFSAPVSVGGAAGAGGFGTISSGRAARVGGKQISQEVKGAEAERRVAGGLAAEAKVGASAEDGLTASARAEIKARGPAGEASASGESQTSAKIKSTVQVQAEADRQGQSRFIGTAIQDSDQARVGAGSGIAGVPAGGAPLMAGVSGTAGLGVNLVGGSTRPAGAEAAAVVAGARSATGEIVTAGRPQADGIVKPPLGPSVSSAAPVSQTDRTGIRPSKDQPSVQEETASPPIPHKQEYDRQMAVMQAGDRALKEKLGALSAAANAAEKDKGAPSIGGQADKSGLAGAGPDLKPEAAGTAKAPQAGEGASRPDQAGVAAPALRQAGQAGGQPDLEDRAQASQGDAPTGEKTSQKPALSPSSPLPAKPDASSDQAEQQEPADKLAKNQERALRTAYEGSNRLKNLAKKRGIQAAESLAGRVTTEIWWWALGGYLPTWSLSVFVMDWYWFLHKKNPALFPMRLWMKITTVVLHLLPVAAAGVLILMIWYVGCNYPTNKLGVRGTVVGLVYPEACEALQSLESAAKQTLSYMTSPAVQRPLPSDTPCAPVLSGPASVENLSATCFGGNAAYASLVANAESGGDPTSESRVDRCGADSVSIGLFQINLTAHRLPGLDCPSAFDRRYDGPKTNCRVINRGLYDQCVQAAKTSGINIQRACEISGNGSNWQAWRTTANRCGF